MDLVTHDHHLVAKFMTVESTPLSSAGFDEIMHIRQARDDVPQALAIKEVDPTLYVDTSFSAHITNDAGNLANLVPYIGSDKIMMGDGSHLNISHIGDCIEIKINKKTLN